MMRRFRTVLATALLLLLPVLALPGAPATAQGATRVAVAEFTPLPAAATPSPEVREVRDRLLGTGWDDPDLVTLHWTGVSSFVLTIGGHVVLLDAWEIVGVHADYVPIGREELAGLEPEAILIGHGHFDHAADAGYVAGRSGAVVVGSEEICDTAEADAARDGNTITCAITGTATTPAPGTAQSLRLFEDLDPVTVLQHIHSAATPPGEGNEPGPQLPVFDPTPYIENPNLDPQELARFIETLQDPQGGTWLYHFGVGEFTLLWGDSAGPIFTPEAAPVVEALGAFPGCVDVMANAILGFDQPVSGLQDPRLYVDAVRPKVYLPQHGDAWAPAISAGQEQYIPVWREENEVLGIHQPATRFLLDPADYLRRITFDTSDPAWADERPGTACATDRIDRRWGPNRFGTAAALAQTRYAPGQEEVWLVPGGSFAEALIAVPAAALTGAPVLLFDDDMVPEVTLDELARLRPGQVFTLNGRHLVDGLLRSEGVDTVAGIEQPDPYLLAATVSDLFFPDADVAYLTTGEDFADALAAGPAAIAEGAPVLLTPRDRLHPRTLEELQRLGSDTRVVVVGGEAAVGAAVVDDLLAEGFAVDRVAGPDRTATAAAVAALPLFGDAPTVVVATGEGFADALTAGGPAGIDGAPVLLVRRDEVPAATAQALAGLPPVQLAIVAGGDAVIAPATRAALDALLPSP